jgi:phosphoglycerate dehydrogenase-like enzyme
MTHLSPKVVVAGDDFLKIPGCLPALTAAEVRVTRTLATPEARAALAQAEGLIVTPQVFPADLLEWAPRARIVAFVSTGYDGVDLEAAARRGTWVTHVPGYCTEEVATHTLSLLLMLALHLPAQLAAVRQGVWDVAPLRPIHRLRGRVLGLLGFGHIGQAVAERARGFGLEVLAHDPYLEPAILERAGARPVALETLLAAADFLSLHLPLTDATRGLVDAAALARLKPGACLINAARGALVDEAALLEALNAGRLAGAALDVLTVEPPLPDQPLLHHPRVIVTPHSAWCSEEAEAELWQRAAEDVARVLRGEPPCWPANRVEPASLLTGG